MKTHSMTKNNFNIIDAHTHFFSRTWMERFVSMAPDRFPDVDALAGHLGWDLPSKDPVDLGRRWVQEQDRYGLRRQVLFASKLNEAEFLAAATNAFPDRLTGYAMVDPHAADVRNQTVYSLNVLSMRGIILMPALFHFHAFDPAAYILYEEALSASVPIFVHFGRLNIPIYQKLGLADHIDLTYSNPMDLERPARDFPEINFIIPHFGCGRFLETLEVARRCDNVYLDTSSSNSWIEPPMNLQEVFRRCLDEVGAQRLLFGTDSSFFPRGWRHDLFEVQLGILNQLGRPRKELQAIFGGNIARILQLAD